MNTILEIPDQFPDHLPCNKVGWLSTLLTTSTYSALLVDNIVVFPLLLQDLPYCFQSYTVGPQQAEHEQRGPLGWCSFGASSCFLGHPDLISSIRVLCATP
jgi:hypothetical protein